MSEHADQMPQVAPAPAWQSATSVFILAAIGLFSLFSNTFLSTADVWMNSTTFTHGAFIPLISMWLIWRARADLLTMQPAPGLLALIGFPVLALCWFLGFIAQVDVIQQFAVWMMIPLLVCLCFGYRVSWAIAFPLGYLIFAVPFGESVIPILMEFTATFTVFAVELVGIPVYREGFFFELPSGSFEVAKACSGIRYLIASVSIGSLYAYLTYRSYQRRVIFIAIAFIVPIIANGLRAFGIVLLAHYSERTLAVGVDHFIYGWVFFGVVIFILFQIGMRWQEPEAESNPQNLRGNNIVEIGRGKWLGVLLGMIAVTAPFKIWAENIVARSKQIEPIIIDSPLAINQWDVTSVEHNWAPSFTLPDSEYAQTYASGSDWLAVYIATYSVQDERRELLSSNNEFYSKQEMTPLANTILPQTFFGGAMGDVAELRFLDDRQRKWVLWYWYESNGQLSSQQTQLKWEELKTKLFNQPMSASAAVALYTPLNAKLDVVRARLSSFANELNFRANNGAVNE